MIDFAQIQDFANYLWKHGINTDDEDYSFPVKNYSKQEVRNFVKTNFDKIKTMRKKNISWNGVQDRFDVNYPGRVLNYWYNKENVIRNGRKVYKHKR